MRLIEPTPTPYDPLVWQRLPLSERGKLVCQAWSNEGYGAPLLVYVLYALKIALYVAGWALCCSYGSKLGPLSEIGSWWRTSEAFQNAIIWSLLFEITGLGCGSGPLTGRYLPPFGGALYFLRPGTTKLPLFPGAPLIGGSRRGVLDLLAYAVTWWLCVAALVVPGLPSALLLGLVTSVVLLGVLDRTLFLAARAEHYWVTLVCFAFADDWIAGAQAVQLALWFWAGVSKLNRHFPSVVAVMVSNSPWAWPALRRRMYRDPPEDLRPSQVAHVLGHVGTALELGTPVLLLYATVFGDPVALHAGLAAMLLLHGFITSNVPAGVPLEWNVMVVYGGFALFWAHPDVSVLDLHAPGLGLFLATMLLVIPLVGNLRPQSVSFLCSMRYYAGNWPFGMWLFRGEAYGKLDRLVAPSASPEQQLAPFYDEATAIGMIGKVLGFRLMHLHGRALPELMPRAVDRLEDYRWVDGELIGGRVLGWNFGDGHLHDERLLRAVQSQCHFEPGELRCVFVESQPLGRTTLDYRIVDAARGEIERGQLSVPQLAERLPWLAEP